MTDGWTDRLLIPLCAHIPDGSVVSELCKGRPLHYTTQLTLLYENKTGIIFPESILIHLENPFTISEVSFYVVH